MCLLHFRKTRYPESLIAMLWQQLLIKSTEHNLEHKKCVLVMPYCNNYFRVKIKRGTRTNWNNFCLNWTRSQKVASTNTTCSKLINSRAVEEIRRQIETSNSEKSLPRFILMTFSISTHSRRRRALVSCRSPLFVNVSSCWTCCVTVAGGACCTSIGVRGKLCTYTTHWQISDC